MLKKIKDYIRTHGLLQAGERVLVALSGGADSVCLLLVLEELGYPTVAAHCNFQLRGDESERDEQFVRKLCAEKGISLHATRFDTTAYAKEQGISIEMAARELRYHYFHELLPETGCRSICVAHHGDDNIETMLINLLRGTGIKGLCGMQPRNGHVVRPLLCCTQAEILQFMQERGQAYMTDSSNLSTDYLRNKIRLQLLPLLTEIAPSARETLAATISNLREELKVYEWCVGRMEEECSYVDDDGVLHISKEGLLRSPSPLSLLHESLRGCGFNHTQLRQILAGMDNTGRRFHTQQFQLVIDRDYLLVSGREADAPADMTLRLDGGSGSVTLPYGQQLNYRVLHAKGMNLRKDRSHAYLDMKKLKDDLHIRLAQRGDSLIPFGMKGRKLVSDLLTDMKIPSLEKERQLVLTCGEKIAWVIGRRASEEFRIDTSTDEVLELELLK